MSEQRLIDANALIPDIADAAVEYGTKPVHYSQAAIDRAKTVEAAPVVHGKWVEKEHYSKRLGMTIRATVCSVCRNEHEELPFGEFKFCPSCGCKMDLEEDA